MQATEISNELPSSTNHISLCIFDINTKYQAEGMAKSTVTTHRAKTQTNKPKWTLEGLLMTTFYCYKVRQT